MLLLYSTNQVLLRLLQQSLLHSVCVYTDIPQGQVTNVTPSNTRLMSLPTARGSKQFTIADGEDFSEMMCGPPRFTSETFRNVLVHNNRLKTNPFSTVIQTEDIYGKEITVPVHWPWPGSNISELSSMGISWNLLAEWRRPVVLWSAETGPGHRITSYEQQHESVFFQHLLLRAG